VKDVLNTLALNDDDIEKKKDGTVIARYNLSQAQLSQVTSYEDSGDGHGLVCVDRQGNVSGAVLPVLIVFKAKPGGKLSSYTSLEVSLNVGIFRDGTWRQKSGMFAGEEKGTIRRKVKRHIVFQPDMRKRRSVEDLTACKVGQIF
jgi:hypothetical protein